MGPVVISLANRQCYAGAMVLGNEALLGAIPMEDMDLVVLPGTQQVAVNPANPNFAASIAKGFAAMTRGLQREAIAVPLFPACPDGFDGGLRNAQIGLPVAA